MAKVAAKKSRCWWFVQLVENLPADWESQLAELMLPGCYIVHDRDTRIDEEGNEVPKKPHLHCIMEFGSPVVADSALNALPSSFGVAFVKPVPNKIGAYRYLMHQDQPEKAPYFSDEIKHMAGFRINLSEVANISFTDVFNLINELKITNFAQLMGILVEFKPEYVDYVSGHVNLVKSYIIDRSRCMI